MKLPVINLADYNFSDSLLNIEAKGEVFAKSFYSLSEYAFCQLRWKQWATGLS